MFFLCLSEGINQLVIYLSVSILFEILITLVKNSSSKGGLGGESSPATNLTTHPVIRKKTPKIIKQRDS